jgi:hypothetical protein
MKFLHLFPALLLSLFSSISIAQPGPSTTILRWKIVVKENGNMVTVDSTNWKQVKFRSGNADVTYRFINQTNYFEIRLKSMVRPDLTISYRGKTMSFPVINHYRMGYYKKVVLGIEEEYDTEQQTDHSKAFFDDPEEHIHLQVNRSADKITICPRNILVKGDRSNANSIPLNNAGLISITRYKTGTPLDCKLDFTTRVDTVAVPTDLKPYAHILLELTTGSSDGGICPDQDSMVYYTVEQLPVYHSSFDMNYQMSIDGKAVNRTLRVPHRFIYTNSDLTENWVKVEETDPASGLHDTRTIYYESNYHVMISPKHPTRKDTLKITVVNRQSHFTDHYGSSEYRIATDKNQTYDWTKELKIAIWHGCGADTKTKEVSYLVVIPPLKESGKYMLKFYGGFLYPDRKRTEEKHCFEQVPAEVVLDIK